MTESGIAPAAGPLGEPRPTRKAPAQRRATRWVQTLSDQRLDSDAVAEEPAAPDRVRTWGEDGDDDLAPRPLWAWVLLLLGLLWLAASIWTAHAAIAGNATDATVVASSAALFLPVVVTASLLAGAAAGLTAADFLAGRQAAATVAGAPGPRRAWLNRALAGLAAGGVCGLLPTGLILYGYGTTSAVVPLAITVGVAAVFGGAAAAIHPPMLAAGIAATLGLIVVGVVLGAFQSPLKALLGGGTGSTVVAQERAAYLFFWISALVGGLVVGLVAYVYLRRRNEGSPWPSYLLAGALPGVFLLVATGLTLVGGARLFDVVSGFSETDRGSIEIAKAAWLNQALVVIFVGAIVAMIAIGRTMPSRDGRLASSSTGPAEEEHSGE